MKRILVTGGNKGIGKAICERLLQEWDNTHVILTARNAERGKSAVEDIIKTLNCSPERIAFLEMDVSSDESVKAASAAFEKMSAGTPLDGIINNAGIGWGYSTEETVNTNYFGVRRVNDAFKKFLKRPGGRIVHIASASGPNFVADLAKNDPLRKTLGQPWTIEGTGAERVALLDTLAKETQTNNGYGVGKAFLNAYTHVFARMNPDLVINSCTPGYILTDITKGMGASNPPSKGAVPPCWLMMDESLAKEPTGRYYGSDCVRSPLDVYRGPGDAPCINDEDV
ncbi:hypothetical protein FisN_17Lh182 [Fistulifera solaris]|uniref:Uncharacterized protein n=1 Tax=Fistulifera solaris TaxID=1519565 RepID=A0A1Z5JD22_FISSO|nr:hypothetical protein FisN_17Lh182 [Fistulifera solaris]|eukprot:GAX11910.1 hypothetical protein FisN_17Lh182 [Fistulifera solaris]